MKRIKQKRTDKREFKILGVKIPFFFVVAVALFGLATIYFAISMSSSGAKLASLEAERRDLIKENQVLRNGVVKNTSLSKLDLEAEELGFVKPGDVIYLTVEDAVAKLP